MASALVSSILSTAERLLAAFQEPSPSSPEPQRRVVGDLKQIQRMLRRIEAALHDAEEREVRDRSVKLWLTELKGVARDAEDLLDEYRYELLRLEVERRAAAADTSRKRKRTPSEDPLVCDPTASAFPSANGLDIAEMANRICDMRERFHEISKDREALRLREEDGKRLVRFTARDPPPTSHLMDESGVFGREDDKQQIIDMVLSKSEGSNLSVVPIVGKGGLGKTTIAQLVYNDPRVHQSFNLRGWVCVSVDFDVVRLTKAIIESVTGQASALVELGPLQKHLRDTLAGQRVLLVLDDVWNDKNSYWESLRAPFASAEAMSIIVTTRNVSVAEIMQTVAPYYLGYLPKDHCWRLFRHYAFGGREPIGRSDLVGIGKQIVKKCGGLPLAVKSLGSLLRYELDEDSWKDVSQSALWELDRENEILAALRISYNHMPMHLKPCFLFCSVFPKDYEFEKDLLVRLWMAQGFLQPKGRKRLEDIGREYFDELHRRSFLDFFSKLGEERFKMHDIIHDLARSISGDEYRAVMGGNLCDISGRVLHLYVEGDKELSALLSCMRPTALRTLLFSGSSFKIPLFSPCGSSTAALVSDGCLRVLCVQNYAVGEPSDLNGIGSFKHLRYLSIMSKSIERLPESVCLLYNLQTLDLRFCRFLVELPECLGNLINLRYLSLSSCVFIERLPDSVCQLYNLQSLDLSDCKHLEKLPSEIGNLHSLRYLGLANCGVKRLPEAICQLYNLQTLESSDCRNLIELPSEIGNLNHLRYLGLSRSPINRLPESICRLCDLQTLDLNHCEDLEELPLEIGNLNNLCSLNVSDSGVHYLPPGIKKLTKLQWLRGFVDVRSDSGGIGMLKDMVNLRGNLCLAGLENMVNLEDARDVDLKSKHQLDLLELVWSVPYDDLYRQVPLTVVYRVDEDTVVGEEMEESMLESLQPPANLKVLKIYGYRGVRFPSWMGDRSFCVSIQRFDIKCCKNIKSLPLHKNLGCSSALRIMRINDCHQLTSIIGLHSLNSLEELEIAGCGFLELWLSSEETHPSNLRILSIKFCYQLTRAVGLHNLKSLEVLEIVSCGFLELCLSSEETLPCMLRILSIKSCEQLTAVVGLENLNSLEELEIISCRILELQLSPEKPLSSKLQMLSIDNCPQLKSLVGLHKLESLVKLDISKCPKLQLAPQEPLPSNLQSLDLSYCWNITSLAGLHKLASLKNLKLAKCPRVQLPPDELLASHSHSVTVSSCPGLKMWCQRQGFNYEHRKNFPSDKDLTISDVSRITSKLRLNILASPNNQYVESCLEFNLPEDERRLITSLKFLFSNVWGCLSLQENLCSIQKLTIWSCTQLTLVKGLHCLTSLRFLVIWDCSELQLLADELLPASLESLTIHGCGKLRSLPMLHQKLSSLKVLHIMNCRKLTEMQGLNNLSVLQTLRIIQCPELQLSPDEHLSSIPPNVDIVHCPGLEQWCKRHHISSIQEPAREELTISDVQEIASKHGAGVLAVLKNESTMSRFEQLFSVRCLTIFSCNVRGALYLHVGLMLLQKLTIWSCTLLTSVFGLHHLASLQCLDILDCPKFELAPNELLPSMLESLVIHKCENLRSLLLHQNLSKLKKLQIINCQKLISAAGLSNLTALQSLSIKQCPKIQLSPDEQLSSNPHHVDIALCPSLQEWCQRNSLPYSQVGALVVNLPDTSELSLCSSVQPSDGLDSTSVDRSDGRAQLDDLCSCLCRIPDLLRGLLSQCVD